MAPNPPSQMADMKTWISAGLSISGSGRVSVSGRISTSGIAAEQRPPRVRDRPCLRTMEGVGSTRVSNGSVSRPPAEKPTRMAGCCNLQPYVTVPDVDYAVSMILPETARLLTGLGINANNYTKSHHFTRGKVRHKFYVGELTKSGDPSPNQSGNRKWKKALRETQTLAVVKRGKKKSPRRRTPSRGRRTAKI